MSRKPSSESKFLRFRHSARLHAPQGEHTERIRELYHNCGKLSQSHASATDTTSD